MAAVRLLSFSLLRQFLAPNSPYVIQSIVGDGGRSERRTFLVVQLRVIAKTRSRFHGHGGPCSPQAGQEVANLICGGFVILSIALSSERIISDSGRCDRRRARFVASTGASGTAVSDPWLLSHLHAFELLCLSTRIGA